MEWEKPTFMLRMHIFSGLIYEAGLKNPFKSERWQYWYISKFQLIASFVGPHVNFQHIRIFFWDKHSCELSKSSDFREMDE